MMIMTEPAKFPLVVELLYAEAPDLSEPWLLDALRSVSPTAQLQMNSVVLPHGEEPAPLLNVIMYGSPLGEGGKVLPDVSQTWDWDGAESAVAKCQSSLLVTEMFGETRTPRER